MDSPGAVPRAVWLVMAVHVVLLFAYSLLVPAFRAPDELLHVDRMRQLAGDANEGPTVAPSVLAAAASSPAYTAGAPPVGIVEALPPGDRPSFDELAAEPAPAPGAPGPEVSAEPAPEAGVANPVAERPPLSSWLGAAVLTVADLALPGWPWSFDRTVALLRLVSVALVATVPLLAWAGARRLGCPPRAALAAAAAVLAVPQLTHVGSVVGDDALVVALAAVVFLLGARVLTGDRSPRTAVLAGLCCGLALLASGSALVLVPWMVGAYLLAPRRASANPDPMPADPMSADPTPASLTSEDRRLRRGLPVIVVAVALIIGGWWHLGHLVFDQGVHLGLDQPRGPGPGPGAGSGLASRLLADTWGAFGWREAVLATPAVMVATLVAVGALGLAFARGRVRAVRARLAFLVVPAGALAVLAVVAALGETSSGDVALRVEGRVVLVGLVGLVLVAAVGLDQLRSPPAPLLPSAVFVAAIGLQLVAVAAIASRYWAGASPGERLRTVLAFSPWPPAVAFSIMAAGLGLVAWTLVEILRTRNGPSGSLSAGATRGPGPGAA